MWLINTVLLVYKIAFGQGRELEGGAEGQTD